MKDSHNPPNNLLELLEVPTDKKAHEEYYYSPPTKAIRKLLVQYLRKQIEVSVNKSDALEHFNKPAWAEYQAQAIGYRRGLKEIIDLLDR